MRVLLPAIACSLYAAQSAMAAIPVFAHYLASEAYELGQSDWDYDINTAKGLGVDGFVLNIQSDALSVIVGKTDQAWASAEGLGFKLFWSFDLDYTWSADQICDLIGRHSQSPASYKWNGKLLVSTFGGWDGNQNYPNSFWNTVKSTMTARGSPITYAPSYISYRSPADAIALFRDFSSIDGFFQWWTWPADNNVPVNLDTDNAYRNAMRAAGRSGPYIMAVSPWQFKDIGPSLPTQNWVQQSDQLWKYRWEQAISFQPDMVEIVSWNDYGESHYINAINLKVGLGSGAYGASHYVPGHDHTGWQYIAKYYISLLKTGSAVPDKDRVIYWYRPHPKDVTCSGGVKPRNIEWQNDVVTAVAILANAATIRLDMGSNSAQWNAPAGISINSDLKFPSQDGQVPYVQILRGSTQYASGYGGIHVTRDCSYYDFNAWVGVVQA